MLNVTCRDLDEITKEILEPIVHDFQTRYPRVEGEAYLGYPIYFNRVTNEKTSVDMALITKIGVFIFNVLKNTVPNYDEIQNDIYYRVKEKFQRLPHLRNGKKLKFEFFSITYSMGQITPIDDCPIAFSVEDVREFIAANKRQEEFSDFDYNAILSAIQEAYGLNYRVERVGAKIGTKAYKINEANALIEKYDHAQMDAILGDTTGIQRIRGMAGSGKTIVLARKAVEIYMAHRDWTIVITYSTRALKNQLVRYISKFYADKNDGEMYDTDKIKVMQAWGSASSVGVYYDVCVHHGLEPLNFTQAKTKYGKNRAFSKACEEVIKTIPKMEKMYDCILVDEAQDFDKNFLSFCLKVLGEEKRLVYAYDELQQLNEETMPTPKEIFGEEIQNDTPLTVCYRNQSPVIVTAHAIGMGMYREGYDLPLQMPSSPNVWEAIGYESSKEIRDGEEVTLYRTTRTSPELLKVDRNEIIEFLAYEDFTELKKALIQSLRNDINKEMLLPSDIMIIDMDAIGSLTNRASIMTMVNMEDNYEGNLSIHMAGSLSPEDFFRKDSIVYTSVFRAKGNETFMVYIVNAQRCINSLIPRSDRNALFTAITRSKGWVKVMGYGEEMKVLCKEFEQVKNNDFKLHFSHYPTKDERKQMILNNSDLDEQTLKSIQDARSRVAKAKATGKAMNNLQLMMEIMGVSTKEELMKMLMDDNE